MKSIRNVVFAVICASLATGMFTTILAAAETCQPKFSRIDPAPPSGIQEKQSSTVTLYGSCLPTDVSQLSIRFSDGKADEGIGGSITELKADHVTMYVDAPAVTKRQSRRQVSYRIGSAPAIKIAIFLNINAAPGSAAANSTDVEYVTKPVLWAAIRKVDAKADRAIGMAQDSQRSVASVRQEVEALQGANVRIVEQFTKYFGNGTAENEGKFGKRFTDLETGLGEHATAIQEIRTQIDQINQRPSSASSGDVDLTSINKRLDTLEQQLQAVLGTKVKTGMLRTKTIGKAAHVDAIGGYSNPIQ